MTPYQRGYLDALSVGEALESAVVSLAEDLLTERRHAMSAFEVRRLVLERWRNRQSRLLERAIDTFENANRQPRRGPLPAGRVSPLPERPTDDDRHDHAIAESVRAEQWA